MDRIITGLFMGGLTVIGAGVAVNSFGNVLEKPLAEAIRLESELKQTALCYDEVHDFQKISVAQQEAIQKKQALELLVFSPQYAQAKIDQQQWEAKCEHCSYYFFGAGTLLVTASLYRSYRKKDWKSILGA